MKNDRKRTSLVLMELIVCILFFSVVSALCTKIFVTAHLESQKSALESEALIECQSAMEVVLSDNCSFDTIQTIYPNGSVDKNSFSATDTAGNTLIINLSFEKKMCTVNIDCNDSEGNRILGLEATKFTGGDGHE